jgi:hypothetical protein
MRYIKASKVIPQRLDIYSSERFPISYTLSNPITVLYISKRILFGKEQDYLSLNKNLSTPIL